MPQNLPHTVSDVPLTVSNCCTCYIFETRSIHLGRMGSIKIERYGIEGLPDTTDVSQNQRTLVGIPTKGLLVQ